MRRLASVLIAIGALPGAVAYMTPASGQADGDAVPIYGIKIPSGYRDWQLISVNHLAGRPGKQVRAQLGNDIAIKAFREGKPPFPDGAIIAALHAALDINIPNYASAIVSTAEIVASISALRGEGRVAA